MRWIKLTLVILSALACGWTLFAWAASYLPPRPHFIPSRGYLLIASIDAPDDLLNSYPGGVERVIREMSNYGNDYGHFLGFAHIRGSYGTFGGFDIIAVPFWFIVLITGSAPAIGWIQYRRRRLRVQTGKCPGCGYDLRVTPGRCPECGWTAAGSASPFAPPALSAAPTPPSKPAV